MSARGLASAISPLRWGITSKGPEKRVAGVHENLEKPKPMD
jgi:hypothetical protein